MSPKLELVTNFSEVDWVRTSLTEAHTNNSEILSTVIPRGFESYLSVRHLPKVLNRLVYSEFNFEKLLLILKDYTDTPEECFAAIWNGFGWSFEKNYPYLFQNKKKSFSGRVFRGREFNRFFEIPNRKYYLLKCPLFDTLKIGNSIANNLHCEPANMLWPKDRKWFVANEIDFDVFLIGGVESLISEIEGNPLFVTERFTPGVWSDIYVSED